MPNSNAPPLLTSYFNKIFTHEVFSLLPREKLIGLSLVQKIFRWRRGSSRYARARQAG